MKQYFSSLLVCTVMFVKHCELRVVVVGPSSRGRGEYGSNYDSKQQKSQDFLLSVGIDPQSAFITVKYHGI